VATTVAVLGTGIMGAPMARNLAKAGFDVRAWNRTREKAEPLAGDGVEVHDEAAEAVRGAGVVVTMLADGDVVRAVMVDEGVLDAMDDDAIWLQISTIGVEAAAGLGRLAAERGVAYVDAPVSGTKQPAEEGKLVVLASGPDEARERVQPVLDAVAARVMWLGEAGQGSALKLVVNSWVLSLVEGLAESVALAERLGVDPRKLIEALDGGPMYAPYVKAKGTGMIESSFDPSFTLALAAKDARLVAAAAERAGLDLPLPRAIAEQMQRGVDAGHGDEDMSATVRTARDGAA
jgi:3-hydroxyisobutyrate dehydrogenase